MEGRGAKTAGGEPYANITAKNYVPALKLDDGQVLTEGTAILPYIADRNPAANLAPAAGTLERYRLHEWLGYINSEVHKAFGPFFTPGASDAQKAAAKEMLHRRLAFINDQGGSKQFLLGERFTVADAYLFTVLSWLKYIGDDLFPWPWLKAFQERVATRPAVQAALKAEGLLQ